MISLTPLSFILRPWLAFSVNSTGAAPGTDAGADPSASHDPTPVPPARQPLVVLVGTASTTHKLATRLREGNAPHPLDVREEAVIRLSPPDDPSALDAALRRLQSGELPDWLLLLSRPACRFVMERADQIGVDRAALAGPQLAVVGEATADAARAYGLQPTLVAAGATATDLVARMCEREDVRGARVLVPRSAAGDEDVLAPLMAVAREVCHVTAYDNRPAPIDEERWARIANAASAPVIAFLSSSSVTALWSGLPVDLQARLAERARFVAMGPSTAAVLDQVRWPAAAIADPPGLEAVEQCIRHLLA